MKTNELKALEARGNKAVKELRKAKFEKGLPFMINAENIPSNHCYFEYPDGRMTLAYLKSIDARDFTFIRELTESEKDAIRRESQLL